MLTLFNNQDNLIDESDHLINLKLEESRLYTNEPVVVLSDGKQKRLSVMADGHMENLSIVKASVDYRFFCSSDDCRGKKGTIHLFKSIDNVDACVHIIVLRKNKDVWEYMMPSKAEVSIDETCYSIFYK